MITLLGILTVALFSNDNAVFIDAVENNRDNGYKWEYVGKQDVVNPEYSLPLNDKIYFKHTKN
jgi:hypothetical protein